MEGPLSEGTPQGAPGTAGIRDQEPGLPAAAETRLPDLGGDQDRRDLLAGGPCDGPRDPGPQETSARRLVKILPNDRSNPPGKLADAELHFSGGDLDGLKLIGFGIWERRGGTGRNVNGERRSFALLRPVVDAAAQDRVRDQILEAYAAFEQEVARAS